MTVDIYSKYKHPSAAETAARAKEIVRTKCLVQSRSVVTCSVQDAQDYLKNVKEILEQKGKYPTKVSMGNNYHEMKDITERFK